MDQDVKRAFIGIMKEELVPAMGCTEPIALAYVAAKARMLLGGVPERIVAYCSGNMIKNVLCVQIPNSNGMHGIEAAVALGAVGGDARRDMEVLEAVDDADRELAADLVAKGVCSVEYLDSDIPLHFIVEEARKDTTVSIEVRYSHLNIVRIVRNGEVLFERDLGEGGVGTADRSLLSMENIKQFADEIELSEVREIIDRQIRDNMEIAYEGLSGKYGIGIGKTIRECYPDSSVTRMKALAASASEARMDGCDMPVVINSGSGNQGIASSVPVIVYAREHGFDREKLYRALIFSALLAVYQKKYIGELSAFCGAVSASCAACAAITYMCDGTMEQIRDTVDNTLANIPGIICDGAKISCAAKIATSIDAGMMAHYLSMHHKAYQAFTGILKESAGETIRCVGHIGKVGMRETDKEIVKKMLDR